MIKIVVSGSRTISDRNTIFEHLNECISEIRKKEGIENYGLTILHGNAVGVDKIAGYFAKKNGIELKIFPADWKTYGKSAGMIRNAEMAHEADYLIALWDGSSKGTKHMIDVFQKKSGKTFFIRIINET